MATRSFDNSALTEAGFCIKLDRSVSSATSSRRHCWSRRNGCPLPPARLVYSFQSNDLYRVRRNSVTRMKEIPPGDPLLHSDIEGRLRQPRKAGHREEMRMKFAETAFHTPPETTGFCIKNLVAS